MEELRLLIRSRHPILCVETLEEDRLARLLETVARELGLAFFRWSVTAGLRRAGAEQPVYDTVAPAKALAHIQAARLPAVYLLLDFHPYLQDAGLVRRLRDIAQEAAAHASTIVLSAPALAVPAELRPQVARYRLRLPDETELRRAVLETFEELNRGEGFELRLSPEEMAQFVRNLRGLTLAQARRVVSRCVLDDRSLDASDLARALEAKRQGVEESGVLEYVEVGEEVSALGGLRALKEWLRRFQAGFSDRARALGLGAPRGVLFVGVQGCGKSLAAKTVAREWRLPLLRLDTARLFDKYVGESERNLREALAAAEAAAPVVLWIDEIEKAFAGAGGSGDADAGLGRRLFGSFLTWLQEKPDGVFVAATANDLSATPPELLRKGRFDEIFFVDLPGEAERREIFAIHLGRRRQDPAAFDLGALAAAAEGWSGAEIEQAVVAALYGLLAENGERLSQERLLAEIARTVPLSRARAEYVQELREFARGRFVPAA